MKWRIWITWWIIFYIRHSPYKLNIYKYVKYIYWINVKKKYKEKTVNPSITISVNKIENRITFKIKTGYYIGLLTPETMKRTMSKYENDS